MSEKLKALEAAQERVREAEKHVSMIREIETALENGQLLFYRPHILDVFGDRPVSLERLALRPDETKALTAGLLIARRNAVEDVEAKKALIEGMLK